MIEQGKSANAPVGTEPRIEVIESLSEWEKLSGYWNELLKSSRSDSPFLTWEWLFSWAGCFLNDRRKLFIIAVYWGDELVGVAPWYLNRVKQNSISLTRIEFLGTPETGSDYLDVVIRKGKEEQVVDVLYYFLFHGARSEWDCLSLKDIPSDSLFLLHFQAKMEREGKYSEVNRGSYCPFVKVPEGRDWMPSGVSSRRKARFRQDAGRLNRCGEMVHRTVRGEDVSTALEDFFVLYGEKSGYEGSALHRFMKQYASHSRGQDLLQIDFLSIDGRKIAGFLHLRHGNELMLYLMAVDKTFNTKVSSGNVLIGMCLEQAHREGCRHYDLLKGHEAYKFYWADDWRVSLNLLTFRAGIRPVLCLSLEFVRKTAKVLLRHSGP